MKTKMFQPFQRQIAFGAVGLLILLLLLTACDSSAPSTQATPTASGSLQFSTINLDIPADALNSPVVGPLSDNTQMHVRLVFKVNQSQQNQLKKVSSKGQQDLGKLANQIGISDATYKQIKQLLGIQGVTLQLSQLHTTLKVDAVAKTMATLFQTHFVNHKYKGRVFFAPDKAPQLPTFIVNDLVSVVGLDSYSVGPQTAFGNRVLHPYNAHTHIGSQADCNAPSGEDYPNGVAHVYGYDQFWKAGYYGDGLTINLVEIDGISPNDIQNYGACVGYRGHITVKNIDGAPSQPGEESTLDIEQIEGLAPHANIVVYQTSNGGAGVIDELQQIIDDNKNNVNSASLVSISLESPENYQSLNQLKAEDQLLSILNQKENMTVFVASGDCAAFMDHVYGSYSVSFMASDPNVVGIGGTELQIDQQNNRSGEVAWSDGSDTSQCTNSWGSGGGSSNYFPQPNYQSGPGVNNGDSKGFRQVPDASAAATNLPLYFNGQWQTFSDGSGAGGGTSAATPIWAAGMALVNEALIHQYKTFFNGPVVFYYVANHAGSHTPYFDVTQGDNLGYKATPGWDFATGFGAPYLPGFYNVLAAAAH